MSTYRTEFVVGKVLREHKHVESHIYSEGGGGYVGPHGGRVKAAQVKSYNTTRQDIFLLLESGQEISVSFPFNDIMLREGHIVTLISVFRDAANDGFYIRLLNHNTGLIYNVQTKEVTDNLTREEPSSQVRKLGFIRGAAILFVAWLCEIMFSALQGAVLIGGMIALVLVVRGSIKYDNIHKRIIKSNQADLNAEIENMILKLSN